MVPEGMEDLFQSLLKEYLSKGLEEPIARRKALLRLKEVELTQAAPIKLVYISRGTWIENKGGEVMPMRFYNLQTKSLVTVWNRSNSTKFTALDPLDMIEVIARGKNSLTFDDVSASSIKKVGKFDPEGFRESVNYRKLKELVGKDTGNERIITEGDVLFSPREVSNGNFMLKLTDIYDDPGDIFSVFVDPRGMPLEVDKEDRVIVIGTVRYNENALVGSHTINADLVVKVNPIF